MAQQLNSTTSMKLIIQIPAFNEEATIAQALRDLPKKIDGITSIETLVIDDGSSDRTAESARKAGATHLLQLRSHRGLSAAFVAGIDAALRLGADIIVNTDADNQYNAADVARLVLPIVKGTAEVVIGDRETSKSPHMSGLKRLLQRFGSWTVGKASGLSVADVTSGFRAFSRDAAMQINVFNPFTYTLETIIQAGNRNLGVQSVTVRTNAPTRPSRLYSGIGTYLRKSMATIFRIYTVYRPLKTFFAIGSVLMLLGVAIGGRFLWFYAQGDRGGHIVVHGCGGHCLRSLRRERIDRGHHRRRRVDRGQLRVWKLPGGEHRHQRDRSGHRRAAAPACQAWPCGATWFGRLHACRAGTHRDRDAMREVGRQQVVALATQHVAADLPAFPAGGEFAVVLQPAQHELRLVRRQLAVEHRRQLLAVVDVQLVRVGDDLQGFVVVDGSHRATRSDLLSLSSKGFISWSIASRARKMRERTVPIGQSMRWAMSS